MEQVLPGENPDNPDSDPITESNDLKDSGDYLGAQKILMKLCRLDLRCLDAHAHLGNLVFDHWAVDDKIALSYEGEGQREDFRAKLLQEED